MRSLFAFILSIASATGPRGPYWGITTHQVREDRIWTISEIEFDFHPEDATVDMKWFYGVKPNFFVNVPKQIFTCRGIPYTFDDSKNEISIDTESNECLSAVNANFPGPLRLPNPFELPINEAGEIIFSFARKMIISNVYPIDTPVDNFPLSGIEGVAPTDLPPHRRV